MVLQSNQLSPTLGWLMCLISVALGAMLGWGAGLHVALPIVLLVALCIPLLFVLKFEQTVIGLLIIRSSLDIFSEQQIPAILAVTLSVFIIGYAGVAIVRGKEVKTDGFFWFFASWVGLQSVWAILLPLADFGLGSAHLMVSLREWVRLFSCVMIYFTILQMEGRISPRTLVYALSWSLVLPLTAALLQMVVPNDSLPAFLAFNDGMAHDPTSTEIRINGTLSHANPFATFLVLSLGLTYWRLGESKHRLPWLILLSIITTFLVSTKALVGLVMMAVMVLVVSMYRITPVKLIGSVVLLSATLLLFSSTDFGRERLSTFSEIPFLNPDIDVSKAILLNWTNLNSFHWRVAQWSYLLEAWKEYPWLGYGLESSVYLTPFANAPHNDYIRALVDSGIIGLGSFLIFLFANLIKLLNVFNAPHITESQRKLCLIVLAVGIAMAVGMLTDNVWSHTTLIFYWLSLSAVLGWRWDLYDTDYDEALRKMDNA